MFIVVAKKHVRQECIIVLGKFNMAVGFIINLAKYDFFKSEKKMLGYMSR